MPIINSILDYCRLFLRRSSIFKPGLGRSAGEGIGYPIQYSWASLVAQLVKNPPAMWETRVRSLGWEDPLEKGKGYPLQYSGLENSTDCVHGVAESEPRSECKTYGLDAALFTIAKVTV